MTTEQPIDCLTRRARRLCFEAEGARTVWESLQAEIGDGAGLPPGSLAERLCRIAFEAFAKVEAASVEACRLRDLEIDRTSPF